jgi:hypothetical protein
MTEGATLAAKLQAEGEKFIHFATGVADHQWNIEVYTEGEVWTIRAVFTHLLSAERAFVKLFAQIRDGGAGVSEDFSIDRYNAAQQRWTSELSPAGVIDQFRAAREQMVSFVSGLSDPDLERRGRHPFLGIVSLREMVKMIYIHNQTHLRDVRQALQAHSEAA